MLCAHKFKTINTVSRRAHKEGSNKFRSGFEEADAIGIKILVARRQQCSKCDKKRTTIEILKTQFNSIIEKLPSKIPNETNDGMLSKIEGKIRRYLIKVSKGQIKTRHKNKAMYKEVWNYIYPARQFGRGNTNEVVEWIVNISNFDTDNDKPPLNSIVVRCDTGMPGSSWDEWRKHSNTPFKNAEEAQLACWEFWK